MSSDEWLIRTSKNFILRPVPKARLIEMIRGHEIGLQDEVCRGNGYWIYLHEAEEVAKQLGIQVPRPAAAPDEEITETTRSAVPETASDALAPPLPDYPELGDEAAEQTSILRPSQPSPSARPFPVARKVPVGSLPAGSADLHIPTRPSLEVLGGQIERSSIWRGLAWALGVVLFMLLWTVLKKLRNT